MSGDNVEQLRAELIFTLDMAEKILTSSANDPADAVRKAAGTLAQIIHMVTPNERREATLTSLVSMLRSYLTILDQVRATETKP